MNDLDDDKKKKEMSAYIRGLAAIYPFEELTEDEEEIWVKHIQWTKERRKKESK